MSLWRTLFSWGGSSNAEPSKRSQKLDTKLATKYGLESGSCERSDGLVQAGWASMRGKRPLNEDTVYCQFHKAQPEGEAEADGGGVEVGAFGVFDGHGGPVASRFVRDHLFPNVLDHAAFPENACKAMEEAYRETDQQYIDLDSEHQRDDGCTAVTACLIGQRLVVAHVGDSRAVLHHSKGTTALSRDHKPDRQDERGRIENAGGTVVWAGTWRVGGVLAVSRSFGNRMLKQFIIPHPEIREDHLGPGNRCLVLASDGLWDVMYNEEATQLALKWQRHGAELAARMLCAEAYSRGSQDNISAVVVFFRFS